jgi:hypothetical protein
MKDAVESRQYRGVYRKFRPFTMIPEEQYVENLRLVRRVANVRGCVVECGTWRGGMIAGIADVLGSSRGYYLFDSFEGLPAAEEVDGDAALRWQSNKLDPTYYDNCTASEAEARSAMSMSAASQYEIVKGWFSETLPKTNWPEPIAILRMDADWYESTMCILNNLSASIIPGGMIIVDDYHTWEGCTKAVNEFAGARKWRIRQSSGGVCFIMV